MKFGDGSCFSLAKREPLMLCVTEAVKGKHNIKGSRLAKEKQDLMKFGDGSDQFTNQAHKNMTYISRLQCVQAAVENQLDEMTKGAADRKVGIVAFNNDVTIIGDGLKDPQTITGDKLFNYDFLTQNGEKEGAMRME